VAWAGAHRAGAGVVNVEQLALLGIVGWLWKFLHMFRTNNDLEQEIVGIGETAAAVTYHRSFSIASNDGVE
jgi:hypothetical protein